MSTVVIVDDSEVELSIFVNALQNAGHKCIGVTESRKALEVVKESKPDFVILDYTMPHKTGLELCKDLKLDLETRNIPVLFLSSHDDPDSIIATMHLGCIDYIRKPVEVNELVDLLLRHEIGTKIKDALEPIRLSAEKLRAKYERREP